MGAPTSRLVVRGRFTVSHSHYDPLPHNLADKVIQEAVASGRVRAHEEDE